MEQVEYLRKFLPGCSKWHLGIIYHYIHLFGKLTWRQARDQNESGYCDDPVSVFVCIRPVLDWCPYWRQPDPGCLEHFQCKWMMTDRGTSGRRGPSRGPRGRCPWPGRCPCGISWHWLSATCPGSLSSSSSAQPGHCRDCSETPQIHWRRPERENPLHSRLLPAVGDEIFLLQLEIFRMRKKVK